MVKKLKIGSAYNSMTFEDGFNEFILNARATALRDATINHYNEGFKSITRFVDKNTLLKDINNKTVDELIMSYKTLNISSQSIHTYIRDFKTMLNFFMKQEYVKQFKISLPRVDKTAIETYSDEDLKLLLKKPIMKNITFVEMRDWTIVNFLMSVGIRSNSLINLKVKDIDFDNDIVRVNVTKNHKPLLIPLNVTIVKILKDYLKIRQHKSDEDCLFPTAFGTIFHRKTLNDTLNVFDLLILLQLAHGLCPGAA